MKDTIRQLEKQISQNNKLLEDIPVLRSCHDTIAPKATQIATKAENSVLPPFRGVQYTVLSFAILELNDCLVTHLEKNHYFAAESLSRIAIEHAVNLMYLLDEDKRSFSLLNHYFDVSRDKAHKWLQLSKKTNDETGKAMAKAKLDSLLLFREYLLGKDFNGTAKWPNTFERFKAVGLDEMYRTVYAAASDSVHSMSEDIFNFTLTKYFPQEIKSWHLNAYSVERKAFAVYLVATAMSCWCEASIRMADKINMQKSKNTLLKSGEILRAVCNKHNIIAGEDWIEFIKNH